MVKNTTIKLNLINVFKIAVNEKIKSDIFLL
jgi:hypothetical protein